ncbi:hypothetical protein CMU55_19445 [Elizabethkingia anophelis]|nr:hypothetical protein [Elizabethkingia anophelis]
MTDPMKFRGIREIHRRELHSKSHSRTKVIEMHKRNLAAKMVMEMPIEFLDEVFNMHEKETEFGIEIRGEIILKEKFDPIIPHKE